MEKDMKSIFHSVIFAEFPYAGLRPAVGNQHETSVQNRLTHFSEHSHRGMQKRLT